MFYIFRNLSSPTRSILLGIGSKIIIIFSNIVDTLFVFFLKYCNMHPKILTEETKVREEKYRQSIPRLAITFTVL
jgi:hypothetical protein